MSLDSPRLRLGVLAVVVVSLFAALFARLWYLQVVAAPTFQRVAEGNRVRVVTTEAPRGRILDDKGRVLVDNRVTDAITLNRAELKGPRRAEVLGRLATVLGVSEASLEARVSDPRFSPFKPVPIAEDVDKEKLVYIKEHAPDFPGVEGVRLTERSYPNGTLAAQLLGYVGEINDKELASRKSKGYKQGDTIGKSGIELAYEDYLRGTPGTEQFEVDSRGNVIGMLATTPPVQGHDVQLTIDLDIQKLAEDALAQGLAAARTAWDKSAKKHFIAPAGAVVVLDPRDGSVLALASNPSFDPAAFVNGIKPDAFAALEDPANHSPINNRAIQGLYAPGSTFKLVTATAALTRGIITPNTPFNDVGFLKVGNRIFRNAGGFQYGTVNLPKALTVSSDAFFYNLGNQLWSARGRVGNAIQEVARSFGLGARTGIELPYEAPGRVPDPETRKKLHDANPVAFPNGQWFAGDNVNLAIGQGELVVTPLQLANAYATFANGGTVYEPRVASAVVDQGGAKLRELPPRVSHKVDLPPSVRDPILRGLEGAVSAPGGTAYPAFGGFPLASFPVAGKTGTAQVVGKQDTSVFCAFAPVNDPRYTVAVFMEESGFGGAAAAPVARHILDGLAGNPLQPVTYLSGID